MTPDALAHQQLDAAWLQAGASVIQAVGAIAAIWYSVRLAKESAAREVQADRRAEERALAADRAAAERMDRADIRERERYYERETMAYNDVVRSAVKLAEKALQSLKDARAEAHSQAIMNHHNMRSAAPNPALITLHSTLVSLQSKATDAQLIEGLSSLASAMPLANDFFMMPAGDWVIQYDNLIRGAAEAIAKMESLERR